MPLSYNKVQLGNGQVVIDLTSDTVSSEKLIYGYSAHSKDGVSISGELFEDFPESEAITESLDDSSDLDILDDSGDAVLIGHEYANKISISNLAILQQTIEDCNQRIAALEAHCIADSFGGYVTV